MTTLKSMELTDDESYDAAMPISMPDKPDYPFGLCLCLTQDELGKLGLDGADLAAGGVVHFEAIAKITNVNTTDREGEEPMRRVEMQITNMGLVTAEAPKKKRAFSDIYAT